jgi:uncharacterized protein with HEPN domain
MPRSEAQRLQDMLDACIRIGDFVRGLDFAAFSGDERTIRAVLYDLIVLGEAAKGVSRDTRTRNPSIPWKSVAGMKDIATHQYHGIMLDLVWETATVRVPELRKALQAALNASAPGPRLMNGQSSARIRISLLLEARPNLACRTVHDERPGPAPGRSRSGPHEGAFAARGCERGGLSTWARRATQLPRWPTLATPAFMSLAPHPGSRPPESLWLTVRMVKMQADS